MAGLFICQHRRLVYPPRHDYNVCYDCGKKQLRNPATGLGFGKFSHNLEALSRAAQLQKKKSAPERIAELSSHAPKSRLSKNDRTVLVFRNGQRREIREYALQAGRLLVFTKRGTVAIPVSELDIPATQAANARRGVQFRLTG
jgi:hypothetical protein